MKKTTTPLLLLLFFLLSCFFVKKADAQAISIDGAATPTGMASSPLLGGSTTRAIFGFRLEKAGGGANAVTQIIVDTDQDPNLSIVSANLHRSTNANWDGFEPLVSNGVLGASTITFDPISPATEIWNFGSGGESLYFFVVVTVRSDVQTSPGTAAITLSIDGANVTATTGTVTGSDSGPTYAFEALNTTIIEANGGVSSPVIGGSNDRALIGFSAVTNAANGAAQDLDEVVFTLNIDPTDNAILSNYRLINNGASATYSGGGTPVSTAAPLGSPDNTITFSSINVTLSSTPTYFFLVADVDPDMTATTVTTTLTSADADVGYTSGTGFDEDVDIEELNATIAEANGGVTSPVIGGSNDAALIGFSAVTNAANGGAQDLDEVVFTLNIDPTDAATLTNYRLINNGASATYSGGGTPAGTAVPLGSPDNTITFSSINVALSSTPTYFFLVADVDPDATATTITTTLTSADADVGTTSGTGFDEDVDVEELNTTITEANGGVLSSVAGGSSNVALIGFSAVTNAENGGAQDLDEIVFTLNIDPTDAAIFTNYRLINNGASATYSGGGTPVSTATPLGSPDNTITFSSINVALSSSPTYFFLVADLDPDAVDNSVTTTLSSAATDVGAISGTGFDETVTIEALETTITQHTTGIASSLIPGNTDQVIMAFRATTNGMQSLSEAVFTLNIDPTDNTILENFVLINNGSSSTYSGGGTPVGTLTPVGSPTNTLTFSSINVALSGTDTYFFLVADVSINASASDGDLNTEFSSATADQGAVLLTPFSEGPIPFEDLTATFTTIAVAPVLSGTVLEAGSQNQVLAGFSVSSNGTQEITDINFSISSTADISNIRLFRSTTPGSVGALLDADATGTFGGLTETINGTPVYYYLVVNASGSALSSTSSFNAVITDADIVVNAGIKGALSINRTFTFNSSQTTAISVAYEGDMSGFDYGEYNKQTASGLTTANSEQIFGIEIEDGDIDAHATTITSLTFQITNHDNLRTIALFDETNTQIPGSELDVASNISGNQITFSGLNFAIPDGSTGTPVSRTINVYVTWQAQVTDNEQISVSLTNAVAATTGSGLAALGSIQTNPSRNFIVVTATAIEFANITSPINPLSDFGFTLRAVDANGNLDANMTGNVTLSKQSGDGTLSSGDPGGLTRAFSGGLVTWSQLELTLAGDYVIRANHAGSLPNKDQNIKVESLGVNITGPVNQNFCFGGDFVALSTITISESDPADFAVGTNVSYSFILPFGFVFNTALTPTPSETGSNVSGLTPITYPANNIARFTYTVGGTNSTDAIIISGLEVRYTGTSVVSGQEILRIGGTAVQVGNADNEGNPHGNLSASEAVIGGLGFTVSELSGDPVVNPNETRFNIATQGIILEGTPTGGTFSGNGVVYIASTSQYQFRPSLVGTGNYDVTYTYQESTGQQCVGTVTKSFEVYATSINGLNNLYCTNSPQTGALTVNPAFIPVGYEVQDLVYWDFNGSIYTWILFGEQGDIFNPGDWIETINRFGGVFYLGYRIKLTGSLDNPSASAYNYEVVRVFTPPSVSFSGLLSSFCATSSSVDLIGTPTPTNPVTDNFDADDGVTGSIASGFEFDPSLVPPGSYGTPIEVTYTYAQTFSYAGQNISCSNSASQFTTVYAIPSQVNETDISVLGTPTTFGQIPLTQTCQNSPLPSLDAAVVGGVTYEWYSNLGLTNLLQINNSFNPPVNTGSVGTSTFYVAQRINGCLSPGLEVQASVLAPPTVNAGPSSFTICAGGEVDLTALGSNSSITAFWTSLGSSPGEFRDSGNDPISPAEFGTAVTYVPSPDEVTNGSAILRLTTTDPAGPCDPVFDEIQIIINSVAQANAGPNQTFCSGEVIRLNGAIGGSATSSTWSKVGVGGAISDPTSLNTEYAPTQGELDNGAIIQFKLETDDPPGLCPAAESFVTITINQRATIEAGTNFIRCAGEQILLSGSIPSTSSATSHTWSGGLGSFAPDPTGLNVEYIPDPSELTSITDIVFSLTSNDPDGPTEPCTSETDNITVRINPIPAAPLANLPNPYCATGIPIASLTAVGSNLKWYDDNGLRHNGSNFLTGEIADVAKQLDYYVTQTIANCESPSTDVPVIVNPLPVADFDAANFCLGDAMEFTDLSSVSGSSIVKWGWRFGDGDELTADSGPLPAGTHNDRSTGTFDHPFHTYSNVAEYTIQLIVEAATGCTQTIQKTHKVGPVPQADFAFENICEEDGTMFNPADLPANGIGSFIASYSWDFDDPGSGGNNVSSDENPVHVFAGGVDTYNVSLTMTTDLGCTDAITKSVSILPYIKSFPYVESFEQSDHGWFSEGLGNNRLTSWQWVAPNGNTINTASEGSLAWLARVDAEGTYYNNERSVLNGPCLDMTQIERPVISLDYWNSTDPAADGAYLEYSIFDGTNWQPWQKLGTINQGLNWYNRAAVLGLAPQTVGGVGQQVGQEGWSGRTDGWISGKFNLDPFRGENKIRLRLVFGTNGDNPTIDIPDGFALDNFRIESRNKIILAENFTNLNNPTTAGTNNTGFRNFLGSLTEQEIVKLQYHTSIGGSDPIYMANPTDPNARAAFYGVTTSYRGYIDGQSSGTFASPVWAENAFSSQSLVAAPIEIELATLPEPAESINFQAVINTITDVTPGQYVVILGVIEKQVGSEQFIVRKLLPSAAGTPFTAFTTGSQQVVSASWDLENISDPNELGLVAFVQRLDGNREVLQAVAMLNGITPPPVTTGLEESLLTRTVIYPNPANNELTIGLPDELVAGSRTPVIMYDAFGRKVYENAFEFGEQIKRIDTSGFASGIYLIHLQNKDAIIRKKVMVVHRSERP